MTEPRRGIFQFKDWLQLLLSMAAVVTLVTSIIGYLFLTWTDWKDVPERIANLEDAQARLIAQMNINTPEALSFLGTGIVPFNKVESGKTIQITYTLRKNIDCRSEVYVRFFDHSNNTVAASYTYKIPAVRTPVSRVYSNFTTNVKIPDDLPSGIYSYYPEIVPLDCGIYPPVVPPMSEAFEVVNPKD